MTDNEKMIAVTEIYVDGNLAGRRAEVVKEPIDYFAWFIGIILVLIGLWVMIIPLESWGLFG